MTERIARRRAAARVVGRLRRPTRDAFGVADCSALSACSALLVVPRDRGV